MSPLGAASGWRARLALIRPDGSGRHAISGGRIDGAGRPGINFAVDFSPSGEEVAFEHFEQQAVHEIYVTSIDGTGTRPLAGRGSNHRPVFSPDGTKVLLSSDVGRKAGSTRLYTVDPIGGSDLERIGGLRGFRVEDSASWGALR